MSTSPRHGDEDASGMLLSFNDARITGRDIGSYNINNTGGGTVNVHYTRDELNDQVEIIRWLISLSVDHKLTHDREFSSRVPDTGNHILLSDVYRSWIDGKPRNLECVGRAGAGKTSIVSAIVEDLQKLAAESKSSMVVLYIYFRHTQTPQAVPAVLANLLGQIMKTQMAPSNAVLELRKEYFPHQGSIPRQDKIFSVLQGELHNYERAYIIVDALDEFNVKDYAASYELVEQLQSLGAHLMITSRYPVPFASGTFAQLPIRAEEGDIEVFVRGRIKGRLKTCTDRSPQLLDQIVEKISSKCDGIFLVARFHMDWISALKTPNEIRKALDSLPSGLEETYELAMNRIKAQDPDAADAALKALAWVFKGQRPLTTTELLHVIAFESTKDVVSEDDLLEKDDILSACGGLVVFIKDEYREDEYCAQFVHFSAQQFFQQHVDKYFPQVKLRMTETCLKYLILTASSIPDEAAQRIISSPTYTDNDDYRAICKQHIFTPFPFCYYAATEWGSHALAVNEEFEHGLVADLFHNPLSPYLCMAWKVTYYNILPTANMAPRDYQLLCYAKFGLRRLLELHLRTEKVCMEKDVQPRDHEGRTAAQFASFFGHSAVMDLLYTYDIDVFQIDKNGMTLLHYAARHPTLVKTLLERGLDPNVVSHKHHDTPLFLAVGSEEVESTKLLLEHGADPNQRSQYTELPIHSALFDDSLEIVKLLLKHGADVNLVDRFGRLALSSSISTDRPEIMKLLLENGADPNVPDGNGDTPLCSAIERGDKEVVLKFLDIGADPNGKSGSDSGRVCTPIQVALEYDEVEILKNLLHRGADPNTKFEPRGHTALCYAVTYCPSKIVKILLQNGADPNVQSKYQATPLHVAVERKDAQKAEILLQNGADPNIRDDLGQTPLLLAVEQDNAHLAKVLLEHSADPDVGDDSGRTPLFIAAEEGKLEMMQSLLEGGADPNKAEELGDTALGQGVYRGAPDVVKVLLHNGADPNLTNERGVPPLQIALEEGHIEIAKLLLDGGADPEGRKGWDETPLFVAAKSGQLEVVKMLLGSGKLDPNLPNEFEETPLILAAEHRHVDVVEFLLKNGADPNLPGRSGNSILDKQVQKGGLELVRILLENGADPNALNDYGDTPLFSAIQLDLVETDRLQSERLRAKPDNPDAPLPLRIVSDKGYLEIVKLLLVHGADPNIPNEEGQTFLSLNIRAGQVEVVEKLLEWGVDVNAGDEEGDTPLSDAVALGYDEIARMLLEKGAVPNTEILAALCKELLGESETGRDDGDEDGDGDGDEVHDEKDRDAVHEDEADIDAEIEVHEDRAYDDGVRDKDEAVHVQDAEGVKTLFKSEQSRSTVIHKTPESRLRDVRSSVSAILFLFSLTVAATSFLCYHKFAIA